MACKAPPRLAPFPEKLHGLPPNAEIEKSNESRMKMAPPVWFAVFDMKLHAEIPAPPILAWAMAPPESRAVLLEKFDMNTETLGPICDFNKNMAPPTTASLDSKLQSRMRSPCDPADDEVLDPMMGHG
jgi:hypothetical protein